MRAIRQERRTYGFARRAHSDMRPYHNPYPFVRSVYFSSVPRFLPTPVYGLSHCAIIRWIEEDQHVLSGIRELFPSEHKVP
jgi:hypothetical protein